MDTTQQDTMQSQEAAPQDEGHFYFTPEQQARLAVIADRFASDDASDEELGRLNAEVAQMSHDAGVTMGQEHAVIKETYDSEPVDPEKGDAGAFARFVRRLAQLPRASDVPDPDELFYVFDRPRREALESFAWLAEKEGSVTRELAGNVSKIVASHPDALRLMPATVLLLRDIMGPRFGKGDGTAAEFARWVRAIAAMKVQSSAQAA